ncbi:hypothetical protein [Microbacterium sp. Leaf151]|uniref:hypothetical protein n=1 Tax=Microbacterium sp. Leaf151 TaxID=1736276 RepID=UPI0006F42158|nr:hypothetical protein [Microbacterium sp. Leaf151]KQR21325.1 hypothetical protein ASF76_13785 [Microbacterium sp. Leaf151]
MFNRSFTRIIVLSAGLLLIFGALSLLIRFVPAAATALVSSLAVAACIVIIFYTGVSIAVAAKIRPLRPVADVSILGKHTVALSKLLVGLLAFFGNTALSWLIALSVAFQKTPHIDSASITNQLWSIFIALAGSVAFVFWMWIAVDLLRARQSERLHAVNQIEATWLTHLGVPLAERIVARAAAWSMKSPWFLILYTFFAAPFVIYLGGLWVFTVLVSR